MFTAWSSIFMRGKLRAGETLLVHGGTSGVDRFENAAMAALFGQHPCCRLAEA